MKKNPYKGCFELKSDKFFQSEIRERYVDRDDVNHLDRPFPSKAASGGRLRTYGDRSDGDAYFRRRHIVLPRLIPVGPDEIADRSADGRRHIIRRLAKALRGERARGRSGHWSYSLNRHLGLLQAFKAERAALRILFPVTMRKWPRTG